MESADGRVAYLTGAAELLATLESRMEQEVYAGKLAEEIGIDRSAIMMQVDKNSKKRQKQQQQRQFRAFQQQTAGIGDDINPDKAKNLRAASAEEALLAYLVKYPDRAEEIVARQAARITNPDRQRQYAYIAPAVSPSQSVRDSVFQSLLNPANRRIEPWAGTALSLLNHPVHGEGSVKYIRPALDELQEVQRTGDIFFPRKWTAALLSSHHSAAAAQAVAEFLKAHPDYPPLLASKILQQADPLCRLHPDKTIEP